MNRRAGFSLLELVVVLAVLALSAGVVVPRLAAGVTTTPAEAVVEDVTEVVRSARRWALARGTEAEVRLDPESGRWRIDILGSGTPTPDSPWTEAERPWEPETIEGRIPIPPDVRVQSRLERVVFRFRESGSAHGDAVTVVGDGRTVRIEVEPWTGAIRVER